MRLAILSLLLGLSVSCSARPPAEPRPTDTPRPPTVTPAPKPTAQPTALPPTATARPATSTPEPNYRQMRTQLLTPLGAMIVAIRSNDRAQTARFLADFNATADRILGSIDKDMSKSANVLHSAIVSVRSHPGNLAALEQDRMMLITGIP